MSENDGTSVELVPAGYSGTGTGDVVAEQGREVLERVTARWLGGLSESTAKAYTADFRAWVTWCGAHDVAVMAATSGDLTEYLATLSELRPATRARRLAGVRSFYAWAREEGLTTADPQVRRGARPRAKGLDAARLQGLTAEQARSLMAAADEHGPREAALVSLLLTTGLRISEALSVTIGALAADAGGRVLLTVEGKGERVRTVVVPPLAVERARGYAGDRNNDELLFVTRTGKAWDRVSAWRVLAGIGRKAGINELHPHQLRHTAATLALAGGTNVEAVRALLGHASLTTTQRYVTAAGSIDGSPAYDLAAKIAPR